MTRFNEIAFRKDTPIVKIGAGLTWTDVYKHLIPKGFNVVGARQNDIGATGLTLGGGE